MPVRSAPRDPIPFEPAPLDAQLAGVLRATGAQAARAVDGRRAMVLAEAGLAAGDDVAALVQLARGAGVVAATSADELDDLVVTTGRTVHILRECDQYPGVVLHVRLDRDRGDVGAARRALAAPTLVRAVRALLTEPPAVPAQRTWPRPVPDGPGAAPVPDRVPPVPVPFPRRPPDTAQRAEREQQEPALVTLTGGYQPPRTGALAVLALPPVPEQVKPDASETQESAEPDTVEPDAAQEPEQETAQETVEREPSRVVSLFEPGTPVGTSDEEPSTGPIAIAEVTALPRRTPSALPEVPPESGAEAVSRPAVLQQSFSSDLSTMQKLLAALRKFV